MKMSNLDDAFDIDSSIVTFSSITGISLFSFIDESKFTVKLYCG